MQKLEERKVTKRHPTIRIKTEITQVEIVEVKLYFDVTADFFH